MFQNRSTAGRQLAAHLTKLAFRPDVWILALPRGGVPVGYEIAAALHVPLDVFVVRKLGVPGHEELAMGAIASGGTTVLNRDVLDNLSTTEEQIQAVVKREQRELQRRQSRYRDHRPWPDLNHQTVVMVDDGLATGATVCAAVSALRKQGPACIIVAVPVGSTEACERLQEQADEVLCLDRPKPFRAVGCWYHDFEPVTDEEVCQLLSMIPVRQPVPGILAD